MFMAYAKHEQEKEDIIQKIVDEFKDNKINSNSITLNISLDDDFSEEDIKYIKEEVYKRIEL